MWLSHLFRRKPAPTRDRAAALADFQDTLADATAEAEAGGVRLTDIIDVLESHAMAVRTRRVTTAPIC